jgi:hypothetical protein
MVPGDVLSPEALVADLDGSETKQILRGFA